MRPIYAHMYIYIYIQYKVYYLVHVGGADNSICSTKKLHICMTLYIAYINPKQLYIASSLCNSAIKEVQ